MSMITEPIKNAKFLTHKDKARGVYYGDWTKLLSDIFNKDQ